MKSYLKSHLSDKTCWRVSLRKISKVSLMPIQTTSHQWNDSSDWGVICFHIEAIKATIYGLGFGKHAIAITVWECAKGEEHIDPVLFAVKTAHQHLVNAGYEQGGDGDWEFVHRNSGKRPFWETDIVDMTAGNDEQG